MLSERLVLKKMLEPLLLPEMDIIVDDGLGFTVKDYKRTVPNVTISTLVKEIET